MTYDPARLYLRAPIVRVVDREGAVIVIAQRGTVRRYDGDSAELVRAMLAIHERPIDRAGVFAALAARASGELPSAPIDELLALLAGDGVLVEPTSHEPRPALAPRRIVLGITGAVAAVDTPQLVRGFQAMGWQVRIAMSKTAARFVAPAGLEALTHHRVWRGMWQRDADTPVPHINLAEWAELVVVYPASATSLARMATGDCSDLVAAVVCATRAPVVLAPSMNDAMYASPAVQRNLETLRADGRWIIHPVQGVEVAHRPEARARIVGPAPAAAVVVELVKHVLGERPPYVPGDALAWEQLWARASLDQLPWHADAIAGPLGDALDARAGTLIDLGTGAGTIAIAAAQRGFQVTAADVSPSALGHARRLAGALPILFVLDDITRTRLATRFDIAVDHGLLHCLPREHWPAYAASVAHLVTPGGTLLLVAHQPGSELATAPITAAELRHVLPAFELVTCAPVQLSQRAAQLFELRRISL